MADFKYENIFSKNYFIVYSQHVVMSIVGNKSWV